MIFEDKVQRVNQCYHCGNKTLMNLVCSHKEDLGDNDFSAYRHSEIFICPVCFKATYIERYWDEIYSYNSDGQNSEYIKLCYPVISFESQHLPQNIKIAFESALKAKNTDSALCLIALRRVLEMICKERGATGSNLKEKIDSLVTNNILPPTLKEASDIIRFIGNSAAHADEIDISTHNLETIIKFIEAVIEYIYILPAKMASFKEYKKS